MRVAVFETVSALLNPNVSVGVSEGEMQTIIAKSLHGTLVYVVPCSMGLLLTANTLAELEVVQMALATELEMRSGVEDREDKESHQQATCEPQQSEWKNSPSKHNERSNHKMTESSGAVRCLAKTRASDTKVCARTVTDHQSTIQHQDVGHKSRDAKSGDDKVHHSLMSRRQMTTQRQDAGQTASSSSRHQMTTQHQDVDQTASSSSRHQMTTQCQDVGQTASSSSRHQMTTQHQDVGQTASSLSRHQMTTQHQDVGQTTNSSEPGTRNEVKLALTFPNGVHLRVVHGDLTTHVDANVIVNPTNGALQNICGVGASIIDCGGLCIQNELNYELSTRKTIPAGTIVTSSSGKLPINMIFHVVSPEWMDGDEKCLELLFDLCLRCLEQFSDTKMTTIAFPCFSTPCYSVPEEQCARVMVNAVFQFAEMAKTAGRAKAISVDFVLDSPKMCRIFEAAAQNRMREESLKKKPRKSLEQEKPLRMRDEAKSSKEAEEKATKTEVNDKCPVCLDEICEPITLEKCRHTFCKRCVERSFQVKKICPLCKVSYAVVCSGNQPHGKMTTTKEPGSLPGHQGYGTIVITYTFTGGVQGAKHPRPGERYTEATHTAYLPDNREGNEVLSMFKVAFDNHLIFTIGLRRNVASNLITWAGIDHKTSKTGGYGIYGYPDPDYLMRVKEQLAERGIYP